MGVFAGTAAHAELPVPPAVLAQVESTVEYCGKVYPDGAAAYAAQVKALIRNASADELAAARESSDYKEAHDRVSTQLKQLEPADALKACRAAAG